MMRSRLFLLAGTALLLAALPPRARAQASAEVRVTSARTHEPIPKATVEVSKPGTRVSFRGSSDAQGTVRFPALDAGAYTLRAEADGYFALQSEFVLKPRQPLSLSLELAPLEKVEQHVEVHATVPLLDTQQTGTSHVYLHQTLEAMPSYQTRSVPALAESVMPGAVLSHDNFVHVRGNELSLHEFINGVSFLDNSHQHFTPGISPAIFESVNVVTGGFPAEFGNRFGGILDITTRSGSSLDGHGSVTLGGGSVLNNNASAEYGGSTGKLGYYVFVGGYTSDRFLNPPEPEERHDFGFGLRGAFQLDYKAKNDFLKLLVTTGETAFQLPNTTAQEAAGRDTSRRLRSQTAILNWQHVFSPRSLLSTSAYERTISDRVYPTSDPVTQIGDASRSTLTAGLKSDFTYARGRHTFKVGVDLTRLRLLESFRFDPQSEPSELDPFSFRGGLRGGQASAYVQDHFLPVRNLTVDLGVRWDHFDLLSTYVQVSPRVGVAYHIARTHSVLHAAYDRFFSPPPLEYQLLAGFIGNNNPDPGLRPGNPRPYRQHYFEAGWSQEIDPKTVLEVSVYRHYGDNSFENSEVGDTRVFVPTNYAHARARGAEAALSFQQLERLGISGRLQFAVSHTEFFGPVSGGLADEVLPPGERTLPAFDERQIATASLMYHNKWRGFWSGMNYRFGSGTPLEGGAARLPGHSTVDLAAGLTLWQREPRRLDFEFNLINLGDNRYQIAKESELTPIQYAPRRVVSGLLKLHF